MEGLVIGGIGKKLQTGRWALIVTSVFPCFAWALAESEIGKVTGKVKC